MHQFEVGRKVELAATPDQIWDAIATGPGVDSWFIGRNEVEPRKGGSVRLTMGGHTEVSTVTAWQPRKRFAYKGGNAKDGSC